ncbi:MAG: pyruvate carboxylase [Aerococcus sp.]|nr:pyruvate carboxylase [Aerococcus sp.]
MFKKLLVANRGEIAIRIFRACYELGIETVAIFAKEDENSVHRFKADESYLVGEGEKPVDAYLDIEDIIRIAKENNVDAIHPGYGFLSENVEFAKRCREEGITFVGPQTEILDTFGDKVKAKRAAQAAHIPEVPGTDGTVKGFDELQAFAVEAGYPIMIKAALGGGGRGMRVVRSAAELEDHYQAAVREAKAAFGSGAVYAEKYIENPKHIEVQILGDNYGNVVHLWERDCSVQRRHQKVVEMAPSVGLSDALRNRICEAARQMMVKLGYQNAGTVEFLVSGDDFYFIEVNPRVQVEHTVTEQITGIDIVQTQIAIASGLSLEEIGIPKQDAIPQMGYAIQCRVTTEDPANHFLPDTGKINTYRSPGGYGVRLDAGNGYTNAIVSPYFDSLIAKLITYATTFEGAVRKMNRSLREYRIRGVKTNIPFLQNVITHPSFIDGNATTTFIDNTPELFEFPMTRNRDRGNKILQYIGDTTINGYPGVANDQNTHYEEAVIPEFESVEFPEKTAKQLLDTEGVEAVKQYILNHKKVLLTETTMRDAHQSLIATRMRTKDMLKAAKVEERANPSIFSHEVWGGATFDTMMRFLSEDPWQRLDAIRKVMPNTLLQMLFRGANGVGYTAYPDNVLRAFIHEAAYSGIDVFRIFDSLNWTEQMAKPIEYVKETGKIAEVAICYTGDIMDKTRTKYDLNYYVKMAKKVERMGADILAIKDMSGLLKPSAAYALVSALKEAVAIPIHLHTHDTAGNGVATYVAAARAGVDIVDVASSAFSATTSQPSMTSFYYALSDDERQPELNITNAQRLNQYWSTVRTYYDDFNKGLKAPETEIYRIEMPGGQYTNLQQQAKEVGLADRWSEVKEMYRQVNILFGDIVKVTPSSKVVGDMALFMVQNHLTIDDFYEKGRTIDFPQSVIDFFKGKLGQPTGGFPKDVQDIILKGEPAMTIRPGELLDPVDFEATKQELIDKVSDPAVSDRDVLSYLMYPDVFVDYHQKINRYSDLTNLATPTFFKGMNPGETITVELQRGKVLRIRLVDIGAPDTHGDRIIFFDLNGQRREIMVHDNQMKATSAVHAKADTSNKNHIGATMPGSVVSVPVKAGDHVEAGQVILVVEAMKMETSLKAPKTGEIAKLHVSEGDRIAVGDLLVELKA